MEKQKPVEWDLTGTDVSLEELASFEKNCLKPVSYVSELPKDEKRKEEIKEISETLADYIANRCDIDIYKKLIPTENFHFFTSRDFKKVADANCRKNSVGFVDGLNNIIAKEDSALSNTLYTINHELLHVVSYSKGLVEKTGSGLKIIEMRTGFRDIVQDMLKEFNEGFTELINYYIIKNRWTSNDTLKTASSKVLCAYFDIVLFLRDMFIDIDKKAVCNYGSNSLSLALRDYITGDYYSLKLISDTYGYLNFDRIASIKNEKGYIKNLRKSIGLNKK